MHWGHDEVARWRAAVPGWQQIDVSHRVAVAEISANLPDEVAHSRQWSDLIVQVEAWRLTNRS